MDTLYQGQEIHSSNLNYDPQNDVSDQFISEWCQNLLPVFNETPVSNPEIIGAAQAMQWIPGFKKKDMRPRILEKRSGKHYLVDSGSAISVVPAGPDDVVDPSLHLLTVSGQRVECCGKKEVEI